MQHESTATSALIAGCGYLGRRVAETWRDRGLQVSAITRNTDKAAELQSAGITGVVRDLSSDQDSGPLPEVDDVLWAVGFDRNSSASRQDIWLDGPQRLLAALPQPPRRLIYISSTSVYGDADGTTVDEFTPPNPSTEGGRCCLQAETLLSDWRAPQARRTSLTILRLAGIYGPGRLLRKVADLKAQTPLAVAADQPLNLIHVDDAVRVIDAVSRLPDTSRLPLLNVVNSGQVTRRQYYTELARLVSAPPPVFAQPEPGRQRRGGNKTVISRLRDQLPVNWQFDDIYTGLQQAVASRE